MRRDVYIIAVRRSRKATTWYRAGSAVFNKEQREQIKAEVEERNTRAGFEQFKVQLWSDLKTAPFPFEL